MWNELGFELGVFRSEWLGFLFDYLTPKWEKLAVMFALVFIDDVFVCFIDLTDLLLEM